jgi:DNA-binding LytR/AlgR family response regulator
MALSAVIVDDEQLARDELTYLLRDYPEVQVVAQGKNGIEAVNLVRDHQPDLLFLDVQMPGLDGFAVVRRLIERKLRVPQLVFATAYDHYAVQAFEVNAVDYLLKPFDKERLGRTVERAKKLVQGDTASADKIDRVLQLLESKQSTPPKVLVKAGGKQLLLNARDIVYARIDDGVITVVAAQCEGQSNYRTIEDLQANLDPAVFWRAHRSYLVNLNHIKEVVPWFNSSYQLRMGDRKLTEVPVSRTQSRRLRELFNL